MLGTLLKYEFKAIGRLLLPLYGAWLIAAVMLGLATAGETAGAGGGSVLFIVISGILYGAFAMVAVILTCILLIQRFYKNLLGNEGYLMFALPVTTGQHIVNKTLSAAVWGTAGLIVAAISGILIAGFSQGFGTVYNNFHFMFGDIELMLEREPSMPLVVIELLAAVFVIFAETATKVYAAIAVGHQWSNHRVLGAIAAYIGFGIIESVLGNAIGEILDTGVMDGTMNITTEMSQMTQMHLTIIFLILCFAVIAAIYGFVAWKLLDKRLNLE